MSIKKSFTTNKKMQILLILILSFLLIGQGCTLGQGSKKIPPDAGVFKSFDKGENWVKKNMILSVQGIGDMSNVNTLKLIFDPADNQAIYLLSAENGLFYTYDGSDSWFQPKQINTGRIEDLVVDPDNKCIIYSTFGNKILKSVDCSRSWQEIYVDTRPQQIITSLAIDFYNHLSIYAGLQTGEIIKSEDGGISWTTINRFDNKIVQIAIYPHDSRIIYVVTQNRGILKSADKGKTWQEINEELRKYPTSLDIKQLIFNESKPDSFIIAAKYGLIKTNDGGDSWQPINLITPPSSADIYALAINPEDENEIYYTTASTFYKTVDGGQNWITRKLPTTSAASYLLIDPESPNIIYMGARRLGR